MANIASESKLVPVYGNGSIPIVPCCDAHVDATEIARLERLAGRLLDAEPALRANDVFGRLVGSGLSNAPRLLIGDQSEIPLHGNAEGAHYGYRIALLAGPDDLVVLAQERSPAFETYLASLLGMGPLKIVSVGVEGAARETPLPVRCFEFAGVFERLVAAAREAGGMCLVPHLATGHVWRLGQRIAEAAGAGVSVCGPPPRLSRRVNDKLWFAARVRDVLGPSSLPPTFSAYGPAALAAHVRHLGTAV